MQTRVRLARYAKLRACNYWNPKYARVIDMGRQVAKTGRPPVADERTKISAVYPDDLVADLEQIAEAKGIKRAAALRLAATVGVAQLLGEGTAA